MEFILTLIISFVVIMFFQDSKGVLYMTSLHKILKNDYGWTQSEIDTMWSYHREELNRLKLEGQSTQQIADHIEQFLNQYKSAFK